MSDTPAAIRRDQETTPGNARPNVDWQDAHFETVRPEYEAMVRSVGLRRGWHVIDVGSGRGTLIPAIAEAVGPTGRVTAFDRSAQHLAFVEEAVPDWGLDCPVDTQVGTMVSLPYPDATFDALWTSNAIEYLTDAELGIALREFRRVVRPGGIVAVKEGDMTRTNVVPDEPARMWRVLAAVEPTDLQIHGMVRSLVLRRWLDEAGFTETWQRTTLIERWAPLRAVERHFIAGVFRWVTGLAAKAPLSADDHAFWAALIDTDAPDHLLQRPDFYYYEAHSLAVGRVPA